MNDDRHVGIRPGSSMGQAPRKQSLQGWQATKGGKDPAMSVRRTGKIKDADGRTLGYKDEHCKKARQGMMSSRSKLACAGSSSKRGHVTNSHSRTDRHIDHPVTYVKHTARPKY